MDLAKARFWYKRAAAGLHPIATCSVDLMYMYMLGEGGPQQFDVVAAYFIRAHELEHKETQEDVEHHMGAIVSKAFSEGTRVELHSLTATALNGTFDVVVRAHKQIPCGRVSVSLDEGEPKAIKVENLRRVTIQ